MSTRTLLGIVAGLGIAVGSAGAVYRSFFLEPTRDFAVSLADLNPDLPHNLHAGHLFRVQCFDGDGKPVRDAAPFELNVELSDVDHKPIVGFDVKGEVWPSVYNRPDGSKVNGSSTSVSRNIRAESGFQLGLDPGFAVDRTSEFCNWLKRYVEPLNGVKVEYVQATVTGKGYDPDLKNNKVTFRRADIPRMLDAQWGIWEQFGFDKTVINFERNYREYGDYFASDSQPKE